MFPIITLGPWQIGTYRLIYALAFLIAGVFAYLRLQALAVPRRQIEGFVVWGVAGAGLGLVAPALIETAYRLAATGRWPDHTTPVRIYYVAAGCLLACVGYAVRVGFPLRRGLDLGCPAFTLGGALARIGCLAAGCCGGKVTDAFWGMSMPDEAGVWAVRYPTQIMSGVLLGSICAALLLFTRWRARAGKAADYPFPGFVLLLSTFLFALERFFVEFFRADSLPQWGPLSAVHLGMLTTMIAALALEWAGLRTAHSVRSPATSLG